MKKKLLVLLMISCMVIGLLSGCGSSSSKKEKTESSNTATEGSAATTEEASDVKDHKKVSLTFWNAALTDIDDSGTYDNDELAYNQALKRYKEKYPYVDVEVVRYGVEEMNQLLTAASLSGDLPDVICTWAGSYTNNYKNLLMNLEDYLTPDEIAEYTGLNICREDMQPDGKLQALPEGLTTYNIFYNKEVFKQAGIEEGYEPATWDDFLNLCKTIEDKTDATPIAMVGDGGVEAWVLSEFFADELGPDDLSKLGTGEIKFNSDLFTNVFTEYKKIFDNGYVNKDFKSTDYDTINAAFHDGKVGIMFGGSWGQKGLSELMGDNVGTFKIPAYSKDSQYGDYIISQPGTNLSVLNATDNPEEAVAFIKTFTDGEYQGVDCSQFGNIPSNKNADSSLITNALTKISNEWIKNDKNLIGFDSLISAEAAGEFYKDTVLVDSGDMKIDKLGQTLDDIIAKGKEDSEN